MRRDFDAVIAGGGPAGSATAILLARAGLSVALVEKLVFPRRKVCGECIAASNLPLLDALGVGAAVNANAGPELRRVALLHADSAVVADLPPAAHAQHRWGRALGRETLDRLLLQQARAVGACVLQPWQVTAIQDGADEQRCLVSAVDSGATETLRARCVIAANGSWEPLPAERQSGEVRRRPSDLLAFKANFRGTSLLPGLLPVISFDRGYGGLVIGDDQLTTVACCVRRDRLQEARRAAPGMSAGDVIEALLVHECGGVRSALRGASRVGPWIAAGPLAPGARIHARDSILRVGNAAAEAHPIIGEGISMALQSAFLLAECMVGTRTSAMGPLWREAVAREYASRWRRAFVPRLIVAAAFAHAAMRPTASAALTGLARLWPGLLTAGARWGGKIDNAGVSWCASMMERDAPLHS
jgi:2-polyprenyl-6-methoxyphenol hydroxylase-like FAD-dependent oxidoreductase